MINSKEISTLKQDIYKLNDELLISRQKLQEFEEDQDNIFFLHKTKCEYAFNKYKAKVSNLLKELAKEMVFKNELIEILEKENKSLKNEIGKIDSGKRSGFEQIDDLLEELQKYNK